MTHQKIELLSPAGNVEKMKVAFAFGADAVYLGIPDFSLRVRINSFDKESVREAVAFAHAQKKKVYVTVNIFAHNEHFEKLPEYLHFLSEIKIDAFIASDPGMIYFLKKECPEIPIHLSTQANCTNWPAVQFWQDQGISRVILGRETKLKDIQEMHKKCPNIELEYFVHGAMCMAYSGRCFLSKHFYNRSANLGDCAQPCRREYCLTSVLDKDQTLGIEEDEHGSYLMNSKDLCLIRHLKELVDAGVCSFKIEGRAKSIYYLATVLNAYRQAIDSLEQKKPSVSIEDLATSLETRLVHRGFTTGFMFEKAEENVAGSSLPCEWEFCGQVLSCEKKKPHEFSVQIKVHNVMKIGDSLEVVRPGLPLLSFSLKEMLNAKGQSLTEAHGGDGGDTVTIESEEEMPVLSVIRRKK